MRTGDAVAMSDEEFERRLLWSSLGGTVATAKGVHHQLLTISGEYYSNGKDDIASAFRIFANMYKANVVDPKSAELQKFIDGRAG